MTSPTPESPSRRTALYDLHVEAGAKLVPFAGYDMPIQYTSILDEHKTVREAAGLFDVSHMGVAIARGADALAALDYAVTRDLSALETGKAAYTLLCQRDGNTVDDLIVYRAGPSALYLVLNASNKTKDVEHFRELFRGRRVELTDPLDEIVLLALQGPKSAELLRRLDFRMTSEVPGHRDSTSLPVAFSFFEARVGGIDVRLATTGYTGEPGVEIFAPRALAPRLWQMLLEAGRALGVKPCGLGARDTLRTEMGYSLYGHELSESINPVEAGLSWAIGWKKPDFVGKDALLAAKAHPARKLVALEKKGSRQAPRPGMAVCAANGERVGEITSGTFSPSLGYGIGLALVRADAPDALSVDMRGTRVPFDTTKRPFLKK
jgi:aminomethyltransferase